MYHAEHFNVSYSPDGRVKVVTYSGPFQRDVYVLYPRGSVLSDLSIPSLPADITPKFIQIPVRTAAVMDTSSLAFIEALAGADKVTTYVPGRAGDTENVAEKVLTSPCQQQRLERGDIVNYNHTTDDPALYDAFFVRPFNSPHEFGDNSVLVGAILDPGPLKRSEWIKFFALFLDKEAEANRIFIEHEKRYNCLKRVVSESKSTLASYQKKIVWFDQFGTDFYPTMSQYLLTFIEDAGGYYQPNCTGFCSRTSSTDLQEMLEQADVVVTTGLESRTWTGFLDTLVAAGISVDILPSVMESSPALQTRAVYNIDKRQGVGGGLDWFEAGIIEPDVVLLDLVKLLYSNTLLNCNDNISQYQTTFLRNIATENATVFSPGDCHDDSDFKPLVGASLESCPCSGE